MALTKWGTQYGVGDKEIDEQHHLLFEMTNRISAAVACRSLDLTEELAALMLYASEHFHSEEALMIRSGYPGLPTHRLEHAAFERQLMRFALQIDTATFADWDRLGDLAVIWMRTHVLTGDMDIRDHLLSVR